MYTRKSIWSEMSFLKVIFFWLIIPIVVAVVVAKNYNVHIDKKTISIKSGVFNKKNSAYAVGGITEVSVYQSFFGRIFNYGTVTLYLAGNKTVSLNGILNPESVKIYIDDLLLKTANSTHILVN
jgi:uncharacterized membrane protein YdbT with pleckstrin-like domain